MEVSAGKGWASRSYEIEIVDYTTKFGEMPVPKSKKLLSPIHPGEILRADFMEPLRLSMNRLALDLRVPVTRIAEIVHERGGITPDTALRLARYFNTSAGFWLNLQFAYHLEIAQDKFSRTIEREVHPARFAAADAVL